MSTMWRESVRRIASNPYIYGFVAAYLYAAWVLSKHTPIAFGERSTGLLLFGLLVIAMIGATRGVPIAKIPIRTPVHEATAATLYVLLWVGLNLILWPRWFQDHLWLSNTVDFWLLLVLLPVICLWRLGYRPVDLGMSSRHWRQNVRAGIVAVVIVGSVLFLITPGGRFPRAGILHGNELLVAVIVAFVLAVMTAALHEEFFFRAVLQTRLSELLGSRVSGITVASLLFALYHLPFRLFAESASGDFILALSLSMSDGMLGGLVMGVLWARTHNLLAPVLVHAGIDTIASIQHVADMLGYSG